MTCECIGSTFLNKRAKWKAQKMLSKLCSWSLEYDIALIGYCCTPSGLSVASTSHGTRMYKEWKNIKNPLDISEAMSYTGLNLGSFAQRPELRTRDGL